MNKWFKVRMKYYIAKVPILYSFTRRLYFSWRKIYGQYILKRAATKSPLKIVVGASGVFEQGWTPTDIEYLSLLDSTNWKLFFKENSIDAILSEHVWEHLTLDEGLIAAQHCFQYLKPNGYIRVAVPDGFHSNPVYIDHVKPYGNGPGADDHKILYDYKTLSNLFRQAGFEVELLEYFDENKKFHYNNWSIDKGMINRSKQFDKRNSDGNLNYTSIIIDAVKYI
ncbi:methyltransferase domain-containing protein [bacterium]|nr:methyltransferase domain-containing protein [bacterium]